MADARLYLDLNAPLPLRRGGALAPVRLAYETWGALNAQRDNVVLIYTGMSPSAHAAQHPRSDTKETLAAHVLEKEATDDQEIGGQF